MTARFSDDRLYRFRLDRDVEPAGKGSVCFILLNPSTADETADDPTVRRCMRYARDWGYRRLVVVNLFGLRSTDPRQLKKVSNPWGVGNGTEIVRATLAADLVVGAWGAGGAYMRTGENTIALLRRRGVQVYAFALTKAGEPVHPLYQRADLRAEVLL